VCVGERELALFAVGGTYYAIDADCPHQGAGLEDGDVEELGSGGACVACPRHGWCFELHTGFCEDLDDYAVGVYRVRELRGGHLCVALEPSRAP
jgi:nitrite reductase/ring-hydroxylating ferredoxin subunit